VRTGPPLSSRRRLETGRVEAYPAFGDERRVRVPHSADTHKDLLVLQARRVRLVLHEGPPLDARGAQAPHADPGPEEGSHLSRTRRAEGPCGDPPEVLQAEHLATREVPRKLRLRPGEAAQPLRVDHLTEGLRQTRNRRNGAFYQVGYGGRGMMYRQGWVRVVGRNVRVGVLRQPLCWLTDHRYLTHEGIEACDRCGKFVAWATKP